MWRRAGLSLLLAGCAATAPAGPASTSPPASAGPVSSGVPPEPPEAETPDPMWQAITAGRVYSRKDGAEPRCVSLELEPELPAGGYTGDVVGPEPTLRRRYEGREPALSQPRLRVGDVDLPLPCGPSTEAAWFVDEERCLDPAQAPLVAAKGCSLDGVQVAGTLAGRHRDALVARLAKLTAVWVGEGCTEHVVGELKGKPFPRPAAEDRVALFPKSFGYPLTIAEEGDAVLVVQEVAVTNPHRPPAPAGGGGIAIGCCSSPERYHVLEVTEEAAVLLRHPGRGGKGGVERWFFRKDACEAG